MIESFCIVLVTKNLTDQTEFYTNVLDLKQLFEYDDTIGLGIGDNLCVVLRYEDTSDSHHEQENKGPIIITFRTSTDNKDKIMNRVKTGGYKIRSMVELPDYGSEYHFVEDADGNEVCLDFVSAEPGACN